MSWFPLEHGWHRNPKVYAQSIQARMMYVVSLSYCSEHMTDGEISSAALKMIAAEAQVPERTHKALISAELWEVVEGGWRVHDYLEHQPSAAKRRAAKEATRERVQRWRGNASRNASPKRVTNAVSNAAREEKRRVINHPTVTYDPPAHGGEDGSKLVDEPWRADGLPLGEERPGESVGQRWARYQAWRTADVPGPWFGSTPYPPRSQRVVEVAQAIGWSKVAELAALVDEWLPKLDEDVIFDALARCRGARSLNYLEQALRREAEVDP